MEERLPAALKAGTNMHQMAFAKQTDCCSDGDRDRIRLYRPTPPDEQAKSIVNYYHTNNKRDKSLCRRELRLAFKSI